MLLALLLPFNVDVGAAVLLLVVAFARFVGSVLVLLLLFLELEFKEATDDEGDNGELYLNVV